MNLKWRKVASHAILALVIAIANTTSRFATHSFLSNLGVILLQMAGILLIVIGIDQTVYKDNRSFRTMD